MRYTRATAMAVAFLTALTFGVGAAEPEVAVTHYTDAVVVYVKDLDVLRAANPGIAATVQLVPGGRAIHVDLAARWQPPAIVLEKSPNAGVKSVSVALRAQGADLLKKSFPLAEPARPKPAFRLTKDLLTVEPPAGDKGAAEKAAENVVALTSAEANEARAKEAVGEFAEFETEEEAAGGLPKVFVPDFSAVPTVTLPEAERVIALKGITHSVYCDTNYPMIGSGHVAISRQTADPRDAEKKSLYISLKQQIYDPNTRELLRWEKFLAELPLDSAWLEEEGDVTVGVTNDRLRLHRTDLTFKQGNREEHLLGESMGGLSQLVYSLTVDDEGNIYFSNVSSGVARFNVHRNRFEQPPINFNEAIKEFLPTTNDIDEVVRKKRPITARWGGYYTIECSRNRIFYAPVMNTRSGNYFQCNGVLSLPTRNWDDPEAFRRGLRLNAACWPEHAYSLWDSHTKPGTTSRKLGGMLATDRGVILSSYGLQGGGGPWRIDVSDDGSTLAFGEMKSFEGKPIQPSARPPRNAGALLESSYGVIEVSRANLHLIMKGEAAPDLTGTVTIVYDVVGKERSTPALADLARSLGGPALSPTWIAMAMPGQADRVMAAAEYGYYLSTYDLNPDADGIIHKSYLMRDVGTAKVEVPAGFTLGPYGYSWFDDGDMTYLFVGGYTGLTRMAYSRNGKLLDAFKVERPHMRQRSLDGKPCGGIKRYCYLVPGIDDRIFLTGHHTAARGGTAFSGGLISFNAKKLDVLERLAYLSRGYHCGHLRSYITYTPKGRAVQRINIASRGVVNEYLDRLGGVEPPKSRGPKIFFYECRQGAAPKDLHGLELPLVGGNAAFTDYEYSGDRRYMVIAQGNRFLTFDLAGMKIIDAKTIASASGKVGLSSFFRPSQHLFRTPDDRLMCCAVSGARATFYEIHVSPEGALSFSAHLALAAETEEDLVPALKPPRAFVSDLTKRDGSYDFVMGRHFRREGTDMRIVRDFILPRR